MISKRFIYVAILKVKVGSESGVNIIRRIETISDITFDRINQHTPY